MALSAGTRLGPYEIQAAIGSGGMGEVHRARDTKLNRDVALKVLPDSFATDFEGVSQVPAEGRQFDVARDGKRFLMLKQRSESSEPARFIFVENWFEELKTRVPTK